MGLDTVEIVMLWEQSLGVRIDDREAAELLTPRMATDLLVRKLSAKEDSQGGCLTQRAFQRIRFGLHERAGVPRREIRPRERVRDLLPGASRRARWSVVQAASGIASLPGLSWGFGSLFGPATVGELARWVVCHAASELKRPGEPWTRAEIRTVVHAAVVEMCGVDDFTEDSNFVRDIGLC